MRKIEPELITGMGYIGDNPGVLYRMGGAGEQTVVTGNPALLEGVKGSRFTSLTLHGKSTQGSTTGAQLLDINNLERASSCQNNANVVDGGLSKRNDDVACPDRYLIDVIPNTIYSISASDFVGGAVVQISDMFQRGESESVVDVRIYKGSNQIEFNSNNYNQLTFSFFSSAVNTAFKASCIMLNSGSQALPYEPYTGGAPSPSQSYPQEIENAGQSGEIIVKVGRTEMDKNPQVVIIPTPGGLPGIPVSSGGNYTDKNGQQWVCDEIDLANGEKVQWIGKLDLKSSSWAKQSRASNAGGFWFSSRIKSASLFGASVKGTISNIGRLGNPYNMVGDYVWALTNGGSSEFRIGFADSTIDSLEKLTNLLNSLPEAYAMYCLAEPIRTPLPPEIIAAYKALHTYSPTTTVINDAGAGMSVGYRRRK